MRTGFDLHRLLLCLRWSTILRPSRDEGREHEQECCNPEFHHYESQEIDFTSAQADVWKPAQSLDPGCWLQLANAAAPRRRGPD